MFINNSLSHREKIDSGNFDNVAASTGLPSAQSPVHGNHDQDAVTQNLTRYSAPDVSVVKHYLYSVNQSGASQILLSTAITMVRGSNNELQKSRALR